MALGHLSLDLVQCLLRLSEITTLMPDLGEEEPGPVTNVLAHVIGEQSFEYLCCSQMMTIGKIHAAEQQFGFITMVFELSLLLRGQQADYRREIFFLVEVEKYFTELRVPYDSWFNFVVGRPRLRRHRDSRQDNGYCYR
jgi:hypothetical protein